jgi:hypothetical protein
VSGLDDADLASATSLAIKNVLDTCKEHFCDETAAASLLQLYGKAEAMEPQPAIELTQGITCARPLRVESCEPGCAGLTVGGCRRYAVTAMPLPRVEAAMPELVGPLLAKIQGLLAGPAGGDTCKHVVATLRRLASIFEVIGEKEFEIPEGGRHPCAEVMLQIWAVLDTLLSDAIEDEKIMEGTTRALKFVVTGLREHAGPMLHPLVVKLIACFQHRPYSCFLYLGSSLVRAAHSVPAGLELLTACRAFFSSIRTHAARYLRAGDRGPSERSPPRLHPGAAQEHPRSPLTQDPTPPISLGL